MLLKDIEAPRTYSFLQYNILVIVWSFMKRVKSSSSSSSTSCYSLKRTGSKCSAVFAGVFCVARA
jgi:hypothetical protein